MFNLKNATGLSFNSKDIKQNEIFIAVRGYNSDGIKYAPEAVKNGARGVVCDGKSDVPKDTLELLKQNNIP